jgi:Leucine-rich repeat (LRR) protein
MTFFKIFLLVSLICMKTTLSQNCVFQSCTCNLNSDSSLNVYCSGFQSSTFPNRTSLNNDTILVKYLVIENYNLKSFPEDIFANMTIETLRINMNNVESMPKNSFRGLVSLKKLEIREYKLNSFGFGLFDTISLSLTELDFSYSGLSNQRFNKFFNSELFKLAKLTSLNLSFNDFVDFEEKWALAFSRIQELNLGRNNLFEIKERIFDSLTMLTHLDLSYNHFSNLSSVSRSLTKCQMLRELILRGNSIETLPSWPILNLTKLDLSENNIQTLNSNSFSSFTNLTDLILKNNKITSIDQLAFASNQKLSLLQLSNNFLSDVPSILNLSGLKFLDLSNQNGNLTSLGDYSFDRTKFNAFNLTVNLKYNLIKIFSNKTFCSKYSNIQSIENIQVTPVSFNAADKCIFKQLSQKKISNEVTISIQHEQNLNYSKICGCNSKVFYDRVMIKLDEACDPSLLNCSCFFLDDCKTKPEFGCDLVQASISVKDSLDLEKDLLAGENEKTPVLILNDPEPFSKTASSFLTDSTSFVDSSTFRTQTFAINSTASTDTNFTEKFSTEATSFIDYDYGSIATTDSIPSTEFFSINIDDIQSSYTSSLNTNYSNESLTLINPIVESLLSERLTNSSTLNSETTTHAPTPTTTTTTNTTVPTSTIAHTTSIFISSTTSKVLINIETATDSVIKSTTSTVSITMTKTTPVEITLDESSDEYSIYFSSNPSTLISSASTPSTAKYRTLIDLNNTSPKFVVSNKILALLIFIQFCLRLYL